MNTPNPLAKLEGMTHEELLARRGELVTKCKNRPSGLPDEELSELVCIYGVLRRRTSPTVTGKKAATAPVDLSAVPADI